MYSYRLKCHKSFKKCFQIHNLFSLIIERITKLYIFWRGKFISFESSIIHDGVWTHLLNCFACMIYVAACNENACYRQNAITFRRLKVFNQHASDEKLPTGDELETDALCGMEVYLQRFSRGISVSLFLQQTLLLVCLMSGERMTKPGYKYLIPCNKS